MRKDDFIDCTSCKNKQWRRIRSAVVWLCILLFCIGWCFGVICTCWVFEITPQDVDQVSVVSASADEATTVAAGPDLTKVNTGWNAADYPTANLIPYPYVGRSTDSWLLNRDGSIVVNVTMGAGQYSNFRLSYENPFVVGNTYFLSGGKSGVILIVLYQVNGVDYYFENEVGVISRFTWKNEFVFKQIYLQVNPNTTVSNVTIYPMLNAGETAYPYQPPFDLIWKDGYKVGYDNGYVVGTTDGYDTGYGYGKEDGYKEGYGDGISVSEYGVFYGANISGKIIGKYTNASQTSTSSEEIAFGIVNPTLVSGGFDFTYLRGNLQSSAPYGWMETEVTVIFKNIVPISMVDLMATGVASSLSSSFTFLDTNGKLHTAQWKQNAESGVWYSSFIDPSVTTENLAISRMTFRWSGGAAGLDVTISQDNIKYYTGYNQGYNEGLTQGTTEGYENGYKEGYDEGEDFGYDKGKAEMASQISDTDLTKAVKTFVFSLFDAPVDSFLSMFNFEWAGFDLRGIVTLVITIPVIIFLVKWLI